MGDISPTFWEAKEGQCILLALAFPQMTLI